MILRRVNARHELPVHVHRSPVPSHTPCVLRMVRGHVRHHLYKRCVPSDSGKESDGAVKEMTARMHMGFILARAIHERKSTLELMLDYLCTTEQMRKWALSATIKHKTQHLLRRLLQYKDFIPFFFETASSCFGQFAEDVVTHRADVVAAAQTYLTEHRTTFPKSLFALLKPEDICDCFRGAAKLDAVDFHTVAMESQSFILRTEVSATEAWQTVADALRMMNEDATSITYAWRKTRQRDRTAIGSYLELIPRLNDDGDFLKEKKTDRDAGISANPPFLAAPTGVCFTHSSRLSVIRDSPRLSRVGPPAPKQRQSAKEQKQAKKIAKTRTENQQNRADLSAKIRQKGGLRSQQAKNVESKLCSRFHLGRHCPGERQCYLGKYGGTPYSHICPECDEPHAVITCSRAFARKKDEEERRDKRDDRHRDDRRDSRRDQDDDRRKRGGGRGRHKRGGRGRSQDKDNTYGVRGGGR